MAILFHNKLISTTDFLKISRRYSSAQSLARAKKKGLISFISIRKVQFVPATPEDVARFYNIPSWEGLQVVSPEISLAGLTILSQITKVVGKGEVEVLSWALLNHFDAIWIAGNFFANLGAVQQCAASMNAINVPTVKKSRRRQNWT